MMWAHGTHTKVMLGRIDGNLCEATNCEHGATLKCKAMCPTTTTPRIVFEDVCRAPHLPCDPWVSRSGAVCLPVAHSGADPVRSPRSNPNPKHHAHPKPAVTHPSSNLNLHEP